MHKLFLLSFYYSKEIGNTKVDLHKPKIQIDSLMLPENSQQVFENIL